MASRETHPLALPSGFGFTSKTFKHRTDDQNCSGLTRTVQGTFELKCCVAGEMEQCTIYGRTSKNTNRSVLNPNGDQPINSETEEVQPSVISSQVEKGFGDIETKDNCDSMDEISTLPPKSGKDNTIELAVIEKERRLAMAEATDSKKETSSIEIDTLCANHVRDQTVTPDPKLIPRDFIDCKPSNQPSAPSGILVKTNPKPAEIKQILITHTNQTDTLLGDYFGATLYTFKRKSGSSSKFQHLLKDIKDGYPAKKMRIREGDELVLIGETFTPDLDNAVVLNMFHQDVKVDGKTRFCLVLRRSEKAGKKKFWYWYETSAILAPDPKEHHKNTAPEVLTPRYDTINAKRIEQPIVYDILNDSTLYMFIDESGIRAVHTEKDDHSVYVNKIIQLSFTKNGLSSQIALCGKDNTSYVHIDEERNVCISNESTWFDKGKHVGDDDSFEMNGYYLAFETTTERFVMVRTCDNQQTIGTFRGYRLHTGHDSPDRVYELGNTPEGMKIEVEETPNTHSRRENGYISAMGRRENNVGTPDDVVPQSPNCLSADNLEIDSSMIKRWNNDLHY